MLERGEPKTAPAVDRAQQHREMAEDLVPALAKIAEAPQFGIEQPEIALGLRICEGRLDRFGPIEKAPLRRLVLEPLLHRFELFARCRERIVADPRGRRMRAQILLA